MTLELAFGVRDRLATLEPKLLSRTPADRWGRPCCAAAGHWLSTEIPDKVDALIEELVAALLELEGHSVLDFKAAIAKDSAQGNASWNRNCGTIAVAFSPAA